MITVVSVEPIEVGIVAVAIPPCSTVRDGTGDDDPIRIPVPSGENTP